MIAALMRHGAYRQPQDVPSAHLPYPLTEEGRRQADDGGRAVLRTAAEHGWTFDRTIDCSRMLRAWETAFIIGRALERELGSRFELDQFDALAERGLGCAANLTSAEIERIVDEDPRFDALPSDWKRRSDFRLPLAGAESMLEAGQRAARHIEQRMEALERERGSDTLKVFVGHGGAFRHAAVEFGTVAREDVGSLSMHHCQAVYLERVAAGRWRHVGGEWKRREAAAPLD